MRLFRFFSGSDPNSGSLFSDGVVKIGLFDFAWANNPEVLSTTFLPGSGGGLSIVDFDEARFRARAFYAKGLLHIDQAADASDISRALEEDAIEGIGIQSFVRSAVMFPNNDEWVVWFSHYFDVAAIGFLSIESCSEYLTCHPELPLLSENDARSWITSWGSPAAKCCFIKYIDENRLATFTRS
jgi:hypothetical protein